MATLVERLVTTPLRLLDPRRSELERKGRASERRLERRRSFPAAGPRTEPPFSPALGQGRRFGRQSDDKLPQPPPGDKPPVQALTPKEILRQRRLRRRTLATIEEGKPLVSVSGGGAMGRRWPSTEGPRGAALVRLRRKPGVPNLGIGLAEEGKPLVSVSGGGAMGRRWPSTEGPRGAALVRLRRKPGVPNLGIGLAGGADKECGPVVSCLRAGSIADRSDGVQVGDALVAVNGIRVATLRHDEILTLLRNAGDEVTLALEYSLSEAHFARPAGTRVKCADVDLRLGSGEEGAGFGFTLRGGAYGPDPRNNRPLTVTNIRPGGPADREGRLRVGDRLLAIGGTDVSSATLHSAAQLIATGGPALSLTVQYDVSVLETIGRARGPVLLEIEKPGGVELGLRLASRPLDAHRRRLFVKHIVPASIADRCGALGEGDELLSVDGVGLECATLAEAAQLLKGADAQGLINLHVLPHHQVLDRASSVPRQPLNHRQHSLPESDSASSKPPVLYAPRDPAAPPPSHQRKSSMRRRLKDSKDAAKDGGHHERSASVKAQSKRRPWLRDRSAGALEAERERSRDRERKGERSRDPNLRASAPDLHGPVPRLALPPPTPQQPNRRLVQRTSYPSRSRTPTNKGSLTASVSGVPVGQVCHAEVMEVVLHSWASGGFGLVLHRSPPPPSAQGPARSPPLFVSYVERGSPAERSGVLQVGDRVLAIDDWPTAGVSAEEANRRLRHAHSPLALTVEFDVIETVLPSHGVFTVKLAKRGQNNLGIVVREAGEGGSGKGQPVLVAQVRTGSVAHRCGSIGPGDALLSIDNIPLSTCTVDEAVRLLARSSDIVKLRVRKSGVGEPLNDPASTVVYSVELSRRGGPLGITIASTDEKGDPVVISQLAPGGLAERTAALHVGDRLLAINGETLAGKRVSEAMGLLQTSADTVVLKIARCLQPAGPPASTSYGHSHARGYHPQGWEGGGKTGTPVQSIDSAVESLDDSPLDPAANRHSKASTDSGQGGLKFAEELSVGTGAAKDSLLHSNGSDHGGDSGLGSSEAGGNGDGFCGCSCQSAASPAALSPDEIAQKNWLKVLEALETVGEEEMLAKLEESIMSGAVPAPHASHCPMAAPSSSHSAQPAQTTSANLSVCLGKPSSSSQASPCGGALLASPFPTTNTILRHPGMGPKRSPRTNLSESSGSLSSGDSGLPPPKPPHSSQILDSIPFITSPRPPPSASSSSIQLSASSTPQASDSHLPPPPPPNLSDVPPPPSSTLSPPPLDIFRVRLGKCLEHGDFGFSISDGASDSGVFINKIRPGGPAARVGSVRPLDRILQVNDRWVERLNAARAGLLLREAAETVTLLLARDATKRPDSIAEEDETSTAPSELFLSPLQTQL